jgi:serine O-acetyltransferase
MRPEREMAVTFGEAPPLLPVPTRLPVGRMSPSSGVLRAWQRMSALWASGPAGRVLARAIRGHIRRAYGCYIAPTTKVGEAVYLPHPVGVVIGDNAVIADGVTIYQNVTIGQDGAAGRCPRIDAGATIFAGATVIGDIEIGAGAVIGANAVVNTSVPAGHIAVGVPARILPPRPAARVEAVR